MGYLGRKTTQQKGESDTLGGATEHKGGFGSQTAALVHFCAHILFGGLSTTPAPPLPMPRTLLGLGRGWRVEERSPHSEAECSGLTSCSAQTVRTSLEWASEFIGEDGGWRRLVTTHSHALRTQQET